ncbi:MAG: 4-hydroxy-tetrahydrodipicolinate reductase [Gammaproteobacteria bacterium]|nr:4-hydroxy-tetrahydrodipicolinate reductase [Gammaproteobacteria bacterium]
MINVAIAGVSGQMGLTLVKLFTEAEDTNVVDGFEGPGHPALGQDAGVLAGVGEIGVPVEEASDYTVGRLYEVGREPHILVDFSIPQMTVPFAEVAANEGTGLVIGTTGQSAGDLARLEEIGTQIPFIRSPNMSVGVNIAFKLIDMATRAMGEESDIEIYEMHHKLKIDSPSGTAVRIGEIVAEARGDDLNEVALYGREGNTGRRIPGSIGFHSARGGDVVGEHTVTFAGLGERIEITHRAQSRVNFASGAVRAARFIYSKLQNGDVGSYDMDQVLGLD